MPQTRNKSGEKRSAVEGNSFYFLYSSVSLMTLSSNQSRDVTIGRTNGSEEEEFSSYLIGFAGSFANVA